MNCLVDYAFIHNLEWWVPTQNMRYSLDIFTEFTYPVFPRAVNKRSVDFLSTRVNSFKKTPFDYPKKVGE
jgi:hypothetical protein